MTDRRGKRAAPNSSATLPFERLLPQPGGLPPETHRGKQPTRSAPTAPTACRCGIRTCPARRSASPNPPSPPARPASPPPASPHPRPSCKRGLSRTPREAAQPAVSRTFPAPARPHAPRRRPQAWSPCSAPPGRRNFAGCSEGSDPFAKRIPLGEPVIQFLSNGKEGRAGRQGKREQTTGKKKDEEATPKSQAVEEIPSQSAMDNDF